MAKAVFIARFIASGAISVKADCGCPVTVLLHKTARRDILRKPAGINQISLKPLKTRQDSVSIGHHFSAHAMTHAPGEDMSTTKASKKTAPAQAPLASQYRAIGPAAILAALLFRKPATAARSR